MRDLGWFLLSGLVIVFWLSFGPRVAAAELTIGQMPLWPANSLVGLV